MDELGHGSEDWRKNWRSIANRLRETEIRHGHAAFGQGEWKLELWGKGSDMRLRLSWKKPPPLEDRAVLFTIAASLGAPINHAHWDVAGETILEWSWLDATGSGA